MENKVNYDEISQVYDDIRKADVDLINSFLQEINFDHAVNVLDIGCGTGNHTDLLQKLTRARVYGLDPSEGMLSKATQKNEAITFRRGSAEEIPFEDDFFDFVYMTDVIHHVPDIEQMFADIRRVLKKGGKVCIVTQSHQQIQKRPVACFFPGTIAVDQARYPEIDEIVKAAAGKHLGLVKEETLFENEAVELDPDFLELVRKKGYSMLHLLTNEEYEQGLLALEMTLAEGNIMSKSAGETLLWFMKE